MTWLSLARTSKVNYHTIKRISSGKQEAGPNTIGKLATALDVLPVDILKEQ